MSESPAAGSSAAIGRYVLHEPIAHGGMGTIHLGRLVGSSGFHRPVALKRLHPHLATDPKFVSMLLDEANLAARIRHPNVVPILDVVDEGGQLAVVMEFVLGVSLTELIGRMRDDGEWLPARVASTVVSQALRGLHAAHETTDASGAPLSIIHRDVSPQNILIGVDGLARITDFGVAKAAGRLQSPTESGEIKGKFAYMAPEQLRGGEIDRRVDVFAAGIVLWELLTRERLFGGESDAAMILTKILFDDIRHPSAIIGDLGSDADAIVLRALARKPEGRFDTADDFANALDAAFGVAPLSEIAAFVAGRCPEALALRRGQLGRAERGEAHDQSGSRPRPSPAHAASGIHSTATSTRDVTQPASRPRRWSLAIAAALGVAGVVAYVAARSATKTAEPEMAAARSAPPPATLSASPSASQVPPAPVVEGRPSAYPAPSARVESAAAPSAAPSAAPALPARPSRGGPRPPPPAPRGPGFLKDIPAGPK